MFITYRTFSFDFRLETAIPLLLREIATLSKGNDISIAFPDEGAFKRFHTMFTSFKFPTITCTKIRDGNRRIVRVKDGKCYDRCFFFFLLPTCTQLIEQERHLRSPHLLSTYSGLELQYTPHFRFPGKPGSRIGDRGFIIYFCFFAVMLFEKFMVSQAKRTVSLTVGKQG